MADVISNFDFLASLVQRQYILTWLLLVNHGNRTLKEALYDLIKPWPQVDV